MRTYVELSESGPPRGIKEFREWLGKMEEKCPPEFLEAIIIDWNEEEGIYCGYVREETAEEAAERELQMKR